MLTLQAQTFLLGFDSLSLGNNVPVSPTSTDTLLNEQTYTAQAIVRNNGNNVFTGSISMGVMVSNDSVTNALQIYPDSVALQQLIPNASAIVQFPNFGNNNNGISLGLGGNVVVVWPKAPNGSALNVVATDSITFNVYVVSTVSISELVTKTNAVVVFPNPSTDYFQLKDASEQTSVEVLDAAGRTIPLPTLKPHTFDVSGLGKGNYVLVIKEKGLEVKKIVLVVQ